MEVKSLQKEFCLCVLGRRYIKVILVKLMKVLFQHILLFFAGVVLTRPFLTLVDPFFSFWTQD